MCFYARVGPAGATDSALGAAAPSLVVTALRGAAVYKNAPCSLVAFVFSAVVDILIKIINVLPQKGHKSTRRHPRGPKSHQKASKGPLEEGDLQDLLGPAMKNAIFNTEIDGVGHNEK